MSRPKKPPPAAITTGNLIRERCLYPIAEAAELLGMTRASLYNRRREGAISLLRIGGRTYVAVDEIERYIRDALAGNPERARPAWGCPRPATPSTTAPATTVAAGDWTRGPGQ